MRKYSWKKTATAALILSALMLTAGCAAENTAPGAGSTLLGVRAAESVQAGGEAIAPVYEQEALTEAESLGIATVGIAEQDRVVSYLPAKKAPAASPKKESGAAGIALLKFSGESTEAASEAEESIISTEMMILPETEAETGEPEAEMSGEGLTVSTAHQSSAGTKRREESVDIPAGDRSYAESTRLETAATETETEIPGEADPDSPCQTEDSDPCDLSEGSVKVIRHECEDGGTITEVKVTVSGVEVSAKNYDIAFRKSEDGRETVVITGDGKNFIGTLEQVCLP